MEAVVAVYIIFVMLALAWAVLFVCALPVVFIWSIMQYLWKGTQ